MRMYNKLCPIRPSSGENSSLNAGMEMSPRNLSRCAISIQYFTKNILVTKVADLNLIIGKRICTENFIGCWKH